MASSVTSEKTYPEIDWPAPPTLWSLGAREVHVWAATLWRKAEDLARCAEVLSPEEHERARRFHFERDSRRFVAGRGQLRQILGHYAGRKPIDLEFVYSERGKPALTRCHGHETVHFNVAHSGELMLVAVARSCAIGVDVERLRVVRDYEDIAKRFFSDRESSGLKALPDGEKPKAFFNLWTRKEAYLKATGEGIGESLSEAEVSFLANEPVRFVSLFGDQHAGDHWRLCELDPAAGYVAALAIGTPDAEVKGWRWTE